MQSSHHAAVAHDGPADAQKKREQEEARYLENNVALFKPRDPAALSRSTLSNDQAAHFLPAALQELHKQVNNARKRSAAVAETADKSAAAAEIDEKKDATDFLPQLLSS